MIIGDVVVKGGGRFEWRIPDFSTLPRNTVDCFISPYFRVGDTNCFFQIYPSGTSGYTHISFTLGMIFPGKTIRKSICTMGVKRADHSEETIGTWTCGGYTDPLFIFNRTRDELENEDWLPDGQLTVTCLFGGAHTPRGDNNSMPRDIKTEHSKRAIEQDSRQDVSKPPEAKANRKVTSRETQTDVVGVKIGKNERLEDFTSNTEAKGVIQLSDNLKGLLTKEDEDYDVRILVKGKEFRAHKCILKARSPVLFMMLTHDSKEKNSGEIYIEDCDPDCFDEFLLFLYCGRSENLTTSRALSLYYMADKYDLPILKEKCVQFLEMSLSATSVCDVVLLAAKHGEEELLRTATEYFVKNMKTIFFTVEWQTFMAENSTVANELLIKSCQSKDT